MSYLLQSFLCLVFLCGLVTGKITNGNFILLPNYTFGAFTFFYEDQIVLGLDVWNNDTIGHGPLLQFYSTKGELQKSFEFPYQCSTLSCNTGMEFIALEGNLLSLQVIPDLASEIVHLFAINLDTLSIVTDEHPAPLFTPFHYLPPINSTTVLFTVGFYWSPWLLFSTLDLPSLSASVPKPTYLSFIISASTVVLSDMIYVCASSRSTPYEYSYVQVHLPGLQVGQDTNLGCTPYAKYSVAQQQVVWLNGTSQSMSMRFIAVSQSSELTLLPGELTIDSAAYSTDFAVSDNFAFVTGRLWSAQNQSYIYQVATSVGKGVVLDKLQVPNSYIVGGWTLPDYNSAISEDSMTYAVICMGPTSEHPPALFILNFDAN